MIYERKMFILLNLIVTALLVSSCAIKDLRDDLGAIEQNYGFFKGQVSGADEGSGVVIGLFKRDGEGLTLAKVRSVSPDDPFYILIQDAADYAVLAFLDSNGDFVYQPGEPAARLDEPVINWGRDMDLEDGTDFDAMQIQQIDLTSNTRLEKGLDFSFETLRKSEKISKNFLKTVSWDDERFSAENVKLGMWEPSSFKEEVGYGLYALKDFDPTQKTILLVHGINDSPRVFESLVSAIPADYQLLLFHYPSAASLEYTSYIFSAALNYLVRSFQIPQLDIIAHSMGGLVSKGMIHQSSEVARQRMRLFISIASPFGGHAGAASGLKWSPVIAPVWRAMAPDSSYLQKIAELDLSKGPRHHLFFTFSHEAGGKSEADDGVVTVKSQLTESTQRNATAIYGIADNHVGAVSNPCTLTLLTAILKDSTTRATVPDCGAANASPASPNTASD
jgi:pimeloyl-ACP methyl ester carboxylesterase